MTTPTQLDLSSPGGADDTRRRSTRLLASKRPASDTVAEVEAETRKQKKKKHKKLASLDSHMIWNEEDELAVLKGLVDYRKKTSDQANFDWDGFYGFIRGSIAAIVSKVQLFSKIKKLKRKFLAELEKKDQGHNLIFNRSMDSEAFGFSMMLWGQYEAENGEEISKEDEEVANGKSADKEPVVDKRMDNGTAGEEIQDDATAAEELCAVQDAFETLMPKGLSEWKKELQLKKLMNVGTRKRQGLSNEWKGLLDEGNQLNVEMLKFSVKLAEAVTSE